MPDFLKNSLSILLILLFGFTKVVILIGLINLNPDPNGEPWILKWCK